MMRITFLKVRQRVCGDPKLFVINVNGIDSGRIQQLGVNWFWYGRPDGVVQNTVNDPKSLDECKAEIKRAFKEAK